MGYKLIVRAGVLSAGVGLALSGCGDNDSGEDAATCKSALSAACEYAASTACTSPTGGVYLQFEGDSGGVGGDDVNACQRAFAGGEGETGLCPLVPTPTAGWAACESALETSRCNGGTLVLPAACSGT